jgi:hypothetical protein
MFTATSLERRRYTCSVCGIVRIIETRPIEKNVVVCVHESTRGGPLPIIQLREQGEIVRD